MAQNDMPNRWYTNNHIPNTSYLDTTNVPCSSHSHIMPIIMPHLFNDTAPSVRGQADAPMYLWSVSKACYGPCWQQVNPSGDAGVVKQPRLRWLRWLWLLWARAKITWSNGAGGALQRMWTIHDILLHDIRERERNRHQGHWDKLRNKMKTGSSRVQLEVKDLWWFVMFVCAFSRPSNTCCTGNSYYSGSLFLTLRGRAKCRRRVSNRSWNAILHVPMAAASLTQLPSRVGEIKNMPNSLPVQWRLEMICQSARRSL